MTPTRTPRPRKHDALDPVAPGGGQTVAKEDRGFASMDPAKQREIASKGGKAAHQKGTAHEWTSEEARDAGRKGGIASHRRRREQQTGGSNDMTAGSDRVNAMERGSGDRGETMRDMDLGESGGSSSERMSSDEE